MTIVPTPASSVDSSDLVAEFAGSSSSTYDILVGVGLVKDSEAVFFQYKGDDQKEALVQPNGKPVTRIYPVQITGVRIEENPYAGSGFEGAKINIEFSTQGGKTVCLTSGLTTMWAQCMLISLSGLMQAGGLNHLIAIDSWKGNSKYGTCFAAIRDNGVKMTDQVMYDALAKARADRNNALKEQIIRDAVDIIGGSFAVEPATVEEVQF